MTGPLPSSWTDERLSADYIGAVLLPGEVFVNSGLAYGVSDGQVGPAGRLFTTTARLLHWTDQSPEPWLAVALGDIVAAIAIDRVDPAWVDLTVHTRMGGELSVLAFVADPERSHEVAAAFTGAVPPPVPPPPPPPPPAPPAEPPTPSSQPKASTTKAKPKAEATRRPSAVPLPRTKDWVVLLEVGAAQLRVLDPQYALAHAKTIDASVKSVVEIVGSATISAIVHPQLEATFARLDGQVSRGKLPAYDRSDVVEAVLLGTSLAQVEADRGGYRSGAIHPVVHATLWLLGATLLDGGGLTPVVAFERAFVSRREAIA